MKKQCCIGLSVTFTSVLLAIAFVAYLLCGVTIGKLVINDFTCQQYFGCSIDEFFDTEPECFKEFGDLRRGATVNDEGFLVIRLTVLRRIRILNSEWLHTYEGVEDRPYVQMSEDYSVVTVYINEDVDIEDKNWWSELEYDLMELYDKVSFMKELKGVPDDQNQMDFVMIDGVTGKVFASYTCEFGQHPHFRFKE